MPYYHVSEDDLGVSPILSPRVPERMAPGEDTNAPRVSVAPNIATALRMIAWNDYVECYWVYELTNEKVAGVDTESPKTTVPDYGRSKRHIEVWLTKPGKFRRLGKVCMDRIALITGRPCYWWVEGSGPADKDLLDDEAVSQFNEHEAAVRKIQEDMTNEVIQKMKTRDTKIDSSIAAGTPTLEAVAEWLRKNLGGFDSNIEINGDTVLWNGRDGADEEPSPLLVSAVKKAIKDLRVAFPEAKIQVEAIDEWVDLNVTIPGAKAAPKEPEKPKYQSVPEQIARKITLTNRDFQMSLQQDMMTDARIQMFDPINLGPVLRHGYVSIRVWQQVYNSAATIYEVNFDVNVSCPMKKGGNPPFFSDRQNPPKISFKGTPEDIEIAATFFNNKFWPNIQKEMADYGAKAWAEAAPKVEAPTTAAPGEAGMKLRKPRRKAMNTTTTASSIRASAPSFDEVKEVLEAFLARHPEVSHDSQISRGSKGDPIMDGAIASMTYEGEGSLFDTMNYGTNNPQQDKAVIEDLLKSLRGIGCYYEQGHDWSLGVYPIEEDSDDRTTRTAIEAIAQEEKLDPEDLKIVQTIDAHGETVLVIEGGGSTFYAGTDDALTAYARDIMEEHMEEDKRAMEKGQEPSYLSRKTYEGYGDNVAVLEYAQTISKESAEERVKELTVEEKREWLDENKSDWKDQYLEDAKTDGAPRDWQPTDHQVEKEFGYGEDWAEEQANNEVPDTNAAYQFLEEMGINLLEQGLIDWDHALEDVIRMDGFDGIIGGDLYETGKISYVKQ